MKLRFIFASLLTAAALNSLAAYPDKSIKFLVPWPPGGATDQVARILALPLTKELGVSVFVENKGGAGGNIGTQAFLQDKADGYSMLMATSSTNAAGPHLFSNQGFDAAKDFTPVVLVCTIPNIMVVPEASPWNSMKDLISDAKQNPGKFTYGSAGIGASQHLAGAQFKTVTGLDIRHVPYKGSGPAAIDLMAGHIDMMLDTGSLNNIKAGKLKALGVAADKRIPELPNVPTMKEAGVPMVANAWYGVMLPAGAPKDVTEKLNAAFNKVLKDPEVRKSLQGIGAQVDGGSVAEFTKFSQSEIKRYEGIVKMSGAPKE
ncbi:tripartite tricarboxylate transporter substrate binding protein [Polynucleobacter sp. AP-Sanab-80-C2]|uniref:Bug family tripartite tricarboxylate transporter substrate binding protein n=1 Tax=Polynucleobacter sp. AP-Sanab-80-C2 TaxID=3108274 RepID=UPI002B239141|nr:tripartite tricarboxylate transporter substrate binding protein [Polynucleobacter sp. AP-Sanab-80-C2]MEA9599737.1 tripartite tricarboxylate transporter substrate binding protein [Polynucleobacter sp. AP-Sanab-80-C2]